ncbi:serine/threonine-protein kinase [Micromonospora krabiensis]|uniref:non-specific serine/threonine protein kinase n=1 Tax=Micromonospora krabiensis TaxID=307121 RepID=A0A1C3NB84_9ACTN|nr:serine/threonine-protein kinase [Micromonospora krabiensis]SBV29855.1 Serine/threonine protein kinase [Micromonospora krabiensis]
MTAALHPGRLLARRYRLLDQIGAGGMSVIWRAHDEVLDRMVALKVLAPSLAADARFRGMVRDEARAAARLVHPHVTAVHDYGETVAPDGSITSFVVMELLTGEELELRLTEGPLPWPEAVEVGAQVADALAAAHRLGVVHRDITPSNVMMTPVGAKVLDFGIATRIGAPDEDEDGGTFGTPAYVAPERLDGAPAQPATDVYSLGVLLYETLTGRVPYPADTWEQLSAALATDRPPALAGVPGLPTAVATTALRCLARDPAARPSARQVATVLREHLPPTPPPPTAGAEPGPGTAPPTTGAERWGGSGRVGPGASAPAARPRLSRASRWAPAGLAVAAVLALGALLPDAPPPPEALPPAAPGTPTTDVPTPEAAPRSPDRPEPSTPDPVTGLSGPLVEAAHRVEGLIGSGLRAGEIRSDVGVDLRNELRNLSTSVGGGAVDLGPPVARLREKVAVRLREGAISRAYALQLDAAIAELATARA